LITIPGHILRKVPIGNTGWSDIGLVQTMPIPEDLDKKLKKLESSNAVIQG
jgi:hypothetical protein